MDLPSLLVCEIHSPFCILPPTVCLCVCLFVCVCLDGTHCDLRAESAGHSGQSGDVDDDGSNDMLGGGDRDDFYHKQC